MRDIKFRAWNKKGNRMIKEPCDWEDFFIELDGSFCKANDMTGYEGGSYKSYLNINVYELMQYTGLKDINGIEIYEGDILKCLIDKGGFEESYKEIWDQVSVFWNEDDGKWSVEETFNGDIYELYDYPEGEIIGNIYENPELLK